MRLPRGVLAAALLLACLGGVARLAPAGAADGKEADEPARNLAALDAVARSPAMQRPLSRAGAVGAADRGDGLGGDLYSCGGYAAAMGLSEAQDRLFNAADIVGQVADLRRRLAAAGLLDVAAPELDALEAVAAGQLGGGKTGERTGDAAFARFTAAKVAIWRRLAAKLNAEASRRHVRAAPFVVEGGCGAGEVPYKVVARQPVSRLLVIKAFYHMLCQAKGIDPEDAAKCFGWHDAANTTQQGAGVYRYRAQWPDGRATTGDFTIAQQSADDLEDDGKVKVLVVPISEH